MLELFFVKIFQSTAQRISQATVGIFRNVGSSDSFPPHVIGSQPPITSPSFNVLSVRSSSQHGREQVCRRQQGIFHCSGIQCLNHSKQPWGFTIPSQHRPEVLGFFSFPMIQMLSVMAYYHHCVVMMISFIGSRFLNGLPQSKLLGLLTRFSLLCSKLWNLSPSCSEAMIVLL